MDYEALRNTIEALKMRIEYIGTDISSDENLMVLVEDVIHYAETLQSIMKPQDNWYSLVK